MNTILEQNAAKRNTLVEKPESPAAIFADYVGLQDRLRGTIDVHLHPRHGSHYWLRRQKQLGFDIRDRIRSFRDLPLLGLTDPASLAKTSVWEFLPSGLHEERKRCIVSESGGTTGKTTASAFLPDEFEAAFITPFLELVKRTDFPTATDWLWIGPTGPHVIGKVVRELARRTQCPDPWSVDFDPRWAKKLVAGSFAAIRYRDHVIEQSLAVLERENVQVLFTTPPVLTALSQRMNDIERKQIAGVHYGGMTISANCINTFRDAFPNAAHLSGYGNSLCGVALESADGHREAVDYFPSTPRMTYETVDVAADSRTWSRTIPGQRGRVMFHRLDRSGFFPNVLERDEAESIPPNNAAQQLGWNLPGLRDPGPPQQNANAVKLGLY